MKLRKKLASICILMSWRNFFPYARFYISCKLMNLISLERQKNNYFFWSIFHQSTIKAEATKIEE